MTETGGREAQCIAHNAMELCIAQAAEAGVCDGSILGDFMLMDACCLDGSCFCMMLIEQ